MTLNKFHLSGLAVLAIAASAEAQMLNGTSAISYGDITIPAFQAQPPAGHPDIAFRPACRQLNVVGQANGMTAYTLWMPDGQTRVLYEVDETVDFMSALSMLAEYGICKSGGIADGVIDVPIIYTSQLPMTQVVQPSVEPINSNTNNLVEPASSTAPQGDAGGIMGLGIGGVVAGAMFLGYRALSGRRQSSSKPDAQTQDPVSPEDSTKSDPQTSDEIRDLFNL